MREKKQSKWGVLWFGVTSSRLELGFEESNCGKIRQEIKNNHIFYSCFTCYCYLLLWRNIRKWIAA